MVPGQFSGLVEEWVLLAWAAVDWHQSDKYPPKDVTGRDETEKEGTLKIRGTGNAPYPHTPAMKEQKHKQKRQEQIDK